jgi:hypothetical protein
MSGAVGETWRATSVKNSAAPARDVIDNIVAPPDPNRNQWVEPPGTCTSVPVEATTSCSESTPKMTSPSNHVERLVPRVAVRRRTAALGPNLTVDLVAAWRKDRDLVADDHEWSRGLVVG